MARTERVNSTSYNIIVHLLALLRRNTGGGDGQHPDKVIGAERRDIDVGLHVIKVLEEVLVVDFKLALLQVNIFHPDILVVVLHLVGVWVQPTVRSNDTIAIEVVVGGGITAIVAAISEDFLTRHRTLVTQALIDKVPDVTALILRIFAN